MTHFLTTLVVVGAACGDLLKAAGMRRLGAALEFDPGAAARVMRAAGRSWRLWLSLVGYAVSFFAFLALVSIEDVSFAAPATAAGYALETLLAGVVLKETITARRWAGAALVAVGAAALTG